MSCFTTAQYTALCKAIADGVLEVQYTDKKVRYRSLNEMMRLKYTMEKDLGLRSDAVSRLKAKFSKGLC